MAALPGSTWRLWHVLDSLNAICLPCPWASDPCVTWAFWGCGSAAWNDLTQGVWKICCHCSKTICLFICWFGCIPHSRRICYFERSCQQESCSFKLPKAFLTALATVWVIGSSPKNKPMSHLNHTLWLFGIDSWNCKCRVPITLAVWSLLWIFAWFHQLPWSHVVHWLPWAADGHSCVDGAWPWEDVVLMDISVEVIPEFPDLPCSSSL